MQQCITSSRGFDKNNKPDVIFFFLLTSELVLKLSRTAACNNGSISERKCVIFRWRRRSDASGVDPWSSVQPLKVYKCRKI